MRHSWIGLLAVGLVLGTAIGIGLSLWAMAWSAANQAQGTPFLRNFSFQEAAAKAGHADWQVLEDRVYEPPGGPKRPWAVSRRIIARARMPVQEQDHFAQKLVEGLEAAISSYGMIKGEFSCSSAEGRVVDGRTVNSSVELPRHYYEIGGTYGVVDAWVVAEEGQTTVIVTWTE